MIDNKLIRAYALKNAVEHEGKAVAGSVISGLFNHGLTKSGIKDLMPTVQAILREVNAISLDEQEKEFALLEDLIGHRPEREGLPELPNAEHGVVMRFAPAASGSLHIGHIIANMSSSIYVKKYGGKFYIRIEDTDPERIDVKSYKSFKKDCDWLFGNVYSYIVQSDRIKKYYEFAEELIKKGFAYVCTCKSEEFKKLVDSQKSCPCRNLDKKENMKRWKKMISKEGYKEGAAVLRFKSDLNDPNPAMRDFPLARINLTKHPRQGKKYRVWPLMNLSVTVDDILFKMTHVIRGKDHKDNAERQKKIYSALGKEKEFPYTFFIGRVKFTDMILSKRKIKAAIEEGKFESSEDVRLPTIASLRKRGYQSGAFEKMAIQRGLSEVDKVISGKDFFEVLNNFNREILREKTRKADFVQCSEKQANLVILMPDASKVFGKSSIKPKKEEVIYFSGFGYAKNNGKIGNENSKNSRTLALRGKASSKGKNAKPIYWFCHE